MDWRGAFRKAAATNDSQDWKAFYAIAYRALAFEMFHDYGEKLGPIDIAEEIVLALEKDQVHTYLAPLPLTVYDRVLVILTRNEKFDWVIHEDHIDVLNVDETGALQHTSMLPAPVPADEAEA